MMYSDYKQFISGVARAVALLMVTMTVQAEPEVTFTPKEQQVEQGEAFAVDIVLRNFPTTQGGGVSLHYNPDVVRATGVVFTGAWNFATDAGVIDNESGTLSDMVFAAFPGVPGNSTVATVWFEAVGKGESKLGLRKSAKNVFASAGEPIAADYKSGKIKIIQPHHHHEHQEDEDHHSDSDSDSDSDE